MRKVIVVIMALLLIVIWPAVAQENTDVCGTLSAADCDVLLRSQDMMSEIRSVVFASETVFSIANEDLPDDVMIRMAADGVYHFNLADIPSYTNITEWLSGILTTLQLDMTITLTTEGIPSSELGIDLPFELEFKIVDGFIYVDAAALEGLDQPQWFGLDLKELVVFVLQETGLPATTPVPALDGDGTGLVGLLVTIGGDVTRLADQGDWWVFEESVTGEQIIADEEIRDAVIFGLYQGFQQQAPLFGYEVDNDELLDASAAYVELAPYMTMNSRRVIDTETSYLHQLTYEIDYAPDLKVARAVLDDVADPMGVEVAFESQVNLAFELNMKAFDDAPQVVAPEDAIVIPFNLIERLIPSGSEM